MIIFIHLTILTQSYYKKIKFGFENDNVYQWGDPQSNWINSTSVQQ